MDTHIKHGFQKELVSLSVTELLVSKKVSIQVKQGRKYRQILSSIREIGLIEPPVVAWYKKGNSYILLDGHLRIMALQELGEGQVLCLVSTDDENFTYNKYINRLSAIQEHRMIMKALKAGVSEDKLAKALNIDVKTLKIKKRMLDGICQEAIDLLKDKRISEHVFRALKKMLPTRQIRVAQLMNDNNRYGYVYVKSLLDGTPQDQLIENAKRKRLSPAVLEKRLRLEEENIALAEDVRSLKKTYGKDMLDLTILQAYLKKLLQNEKVADYLQKFYPAINDKIIEIVAIDFFKIKKSS